MNLTGSSALVTGAASGLGAATAAALAAAGATVFGLDRAESIERAQPQQHVELVAADVTSEDEVAGALRRVADSGHPLRAVVSCAGIAPSARIVSRSGVHPLELFRAVLEVNLLGSFNVMRLAAELMSTQPADPAGQRGVVVNTASIAAYEGQVGQVAYAASKGGVVAMTLAGARDLAQHGIRVMTIAPGIVDTPMMASFSDDVRSALAAAVPFPPRLASPSEYARLVLMILEHDYLNGEVIRMDGAHRMTPR